MSAYTSSFQIFSQRQQAALRLGGKILKDCLKHVSSLVQPGLTTLALDEAAEAFITKRGGKPAFKGYHGFPRTLCTSVNEAVVHGIPTASCVLKDGDIISLDCGVIYDGLYTDACVTVPVGAVSPDVLRFLACIEAVLEGVVAEVVRAGARIGDLSSYIEQGIRKGGYAPVRALTGHGLGDTLHQFPDVPNVGKAATGPILPVGTMIAIEPIAVMGRSGIVTADDHWTILTKDKSLACHFEHSVVITEQGCEVVA